MKFSNTLFAILTVLVTPVSGMAAPTPDYSTARATIDAVVERESANVRTLFHDVLVYHYRSRVGSGSIREFRKNAAVNYSQFVRRSVYQNMAPTYDSLLGPGLYAAVDPFTTRQYGGVDWLLLQIRIHEGTRIWRTDESDPEPYPEDLRNALNAHFGCVAEGVNDFVSSRSCYQARSQVLKQLNVGAITYAWYSWYTAASNRLAQICTDPADFALLLTNEAPFQPGDIEIFDFFPAQFGEGLTASRLNIDAFAEAIGSGPLWPVADLIWRMPQKISRETAIEWAKKNLIGCSKDGIAP